MRWTPQVSPAAASRRSSTSPTTRSRSAASRRVGNNWSLCDLGPHALRQPARHPPEQGRRARRRRQALHRLHRRRRHRRTASRAARPPTAPSTGRSRPASTSTCASTRPPTRRARWALTRPDRRDLLLRRRRLPDERRGPQRQPHHLHARGHAAGRGPGRPEEAHHGGHRRRRALVHDRLLLQGRRARKPHIRGKVQRITDHTGSALDFEYYEDGNLLRLVAARRHATPTARRCRPRLVFTYTTPNGDGPAIASAGRPRQPRPAHAQPVDAAVQRARPAPRARRRSATSTSGDGDTLEARLAHRPRRQRRPRSPTTSRRRVTTVDGAARARVEVRLRRRGPGHDASPTRTNQVTTTSRGPPTGTSTQGHRSRQRRARREFAYNANGYLTDVWDELRNARRSSTYEDLAVDANDVAGKWNAGRTIPHISPARDEDGAARHGDRDARRRLPVAVRLRPRAAT